MSFSSAHRTVASFLWLSLFLGGIVVRTPAADPTDASAPVLNLHFEDGLAAEQVVGDAELIAGGPNAKDFVGLPAQNQALALKQAGAHVRVSDDRADQSLDFTNGDTITLEAWVKIDRIAQGANIYIVGKGRTYEEAVVENQNYALRLTGAGNEAKVSFLFATQDENKPTKSTYHRWTGTRGFVADGGWHHVAVTYTFGDPSSISGCVDGETTKGKWDMGGETKRPPITDQDAVWVGSARGGDKGNSLVGALDDVRIYRTGVKAAELKARRQVIARVPAWPSEADDSRVLVTLHQSAGSHAAFPAVTPEETERIALPKLAIHRLPLRFDAGGVRRAWKGPVLMRMYTRAALPEGEAELLLRSPGLTRVWLNGEVVMSTTARKLNPDAHQPLIVYEPDMPWLRVPRVGDKEVREKRTLSGCMTEVIVESMVGSSSTRCELGETLLAVRSGDQMFSLVGPGVESVQLVDAEFERYRNDLESQFSQMDRDALVLASAQENAFWESRHELARRHLSTLPPLSLPPQAETDNGGSTIDQILYSTLQEEDRAKLASASWYASIQDTEFLRRASLDILGVPPTAEEVLAFEQVDAPEIADSRQRVAGKREALVDRLLQDERWADHWTSYWQDVLAENPNILKPSLNNSGPFRWWLHDALALNKPLDRMVTELIRMEGDSHAGAAAGFEMAAENDVPMAEKAHILASAFLAVDMKCARCHDAPYHPWKQSQLFQIGAMLKRETIVVPPTSSVPKEFFERKGRESPITLTLFPGDKIEPSWPFDDFGDAANLNEQLLGRNNSTRERLAAILTRPENHRFPQVIVNRVWTRLMGWGLVASTDDWHELSPRHPLLLEYLSRQFVESGYDLKQLVRTIMQSDVYQRRSIDGQQVDRSLALMAPWHRRLSAEQVVDSAHVAAGVALETEAITFDPEGSQTIQNFLNLGPATKAWQLTSLSNERDRPSLDLPKAAAVVECMEAFGWRSSRQAPVSHRETEPNVVQPGVVANGHLTGWVTRLTEQSELTAEAISAQSVEQFVDRLFLRILSRHPLPDEQAAFVASLQPGFEERLRDPPQTQRLAPVHRGFVTWSNHFDVKSNELVRDVQRGLAAGPEPTQRLDADWRARAEDAAWALLNTPEFQFVP